MILSSDNTRNDRPHPGPLPRGEGESFAVSRNGLRLDLPNNLRCQANHTVAPPSPGGEGRGEGGRHN